jgi:hypothetical protein
LRMQPMAIVIGMLRELLSLNSRLMSKYIKK